MNSQTSQSNDTPAAVHDGDVVNLNNPTVRYVLLAVLGVIGCVILYFLFFLEARVAIILTVPLFVMVLIYGFFGVKLAEAGNTWSAGAMGLVGPPAVAVILWWVLATQILPPDPPSDDDGKGFLSFKQGGGGAQLKPGEKASKDQQTAALKGIRSTIGDYEIAPQVVDLVDSKAEPFDDIPLPIAYQVRIGPNPTTGLVYDVCADAHSRLFKGDEPGKLQFTRLNDFGRKYRDETDRVFTVELDLNEETGKNCQMPLEGGRDLPYSFRISCQAAQQLDDEIQCDRWNEATKDGQRLPAIDTIVRMGVSFAADEGEED